MRDNFSIAIIGVALATILLVVYICTSMRLDKADFTFCNNDEIRTVDPALASGNIEGRILGGVFEGLCAWDPKTCEPGPGVAKSWDVSPDGLTYTFHLRDNAKWSDGTPVTAHDFWYSFRRCLHPSTGSEYSYELWYLPNAENYSTSKVKPGDKVEIELPEKEPGALPFAPGKTIKGTLESIEGLDEKKADDKKDEQPNPVYVVTGADGKTYRFQKKPADASSQTYVWLLPDFDTVPIRVLDDWTLEMTLSHPVPYFPYLMGFYPFYPVNKKCVETYGSPNWTKPENLVGNGPFVIEYRRIRDRIRLRKSETYWDKENVGCNTIDCLAVKSVVTSLNMYMAGDVDWISSVPPEIAKELAQRPEKDFINQPYFGTYFYTFNINNNIQDERVRKVFQDVRVRRALNMALDKKEFVEKVTRGGQLPADRIVPSIPGKYREVHGDQYNVEEARRLLAEAGYPGGQGFPTIEILYNTAESHENLALLVQHQWKKNLGIDARLQNQEWADYLTRRNLGQFQFARSSWIGDYPDPYTFLMLFQSSSPSNNGKWSNAEYDELLKQSETESDPAKRMEILAQAEELLLKEMPFVPLYFYMSQEMVRNNVRGWYANPIDTHPLKHIRKEQQGK